MGAGGSVVGVAGGKMGAGKGVVGVASVKWRWAGNNPRGHRARSLRQYGDRDCQGSLVLQIKLKCPFH